MKTKSRFIEIKNDLAAEHVNEEVVVKMRSTGSLFTWPVSRLIAKAEECDFWFEIEGDQRTIGRLDDFLCDYEIYWE